MLSTAIYPRVDPRPAAFSERWVTGELRGRLEFGGVAITDDLQTPAVARFGTPAQLAFFALRAGVDVPLFAKDYTTGARAAAGLERAVKSGALKRADLDAGARRVLRLARGARRRAERAPALAEQARPGRHPQPPVVDRQPRVVLAVQQPERRQPARQLDAQRRGAVRRPPRCPAARRWSTPGTTSAPVARTSIAWASSALIPPAREIFRQTASAAPEAIAPCSRRGLVHRDPDRHALADRAQLGDARDRLLDQLQPGAAPARRSCATASSTVHAPLASTRIATSVADRGPHRGDAARRRRRRRP